MVSSPGTPNLAFATKYQQQVFTARHLNRIDEIIRDVCADLGAQPRELNGQLSMPTCW
jgi:putative transposase